MSSTQKVKPVLRIVEEDEDWTESSKNVKGNRKVVRAEYFPPSSVFKIPDGLDLEDNDIVERWYVKYDTLYIKYVGKEEEEEIEPEHAACESTDYKYPDDCLIEDADDHGIEYDDDDEEEKEEFYEVVCAENPNTDYFYTLEEAKAFCDKHRDSYGLIMLCDKNKKHIGNFGDYEEEE